MIQLKNANCVEDALRQSGLWWEAEPMPLVLGDGAAVESHIAVRRGDTKAVLGVVGKDYKIVQNHEAFALLDVLAQHHRATLKYAALIKNGRRVVVQAKIGNSFEVRPGDVQEKYITTVNSFDGSTSFKVFFTSIRLFCMNQMHLAWREREETIAIRHSGNIEERMKNAMRILHLSESYFRDYKAKARFLAQKMVDSQMVQRFINEVFGEADSTRMKNQHLKLEELFVHGKGNGDGSAWSLQNAATEFVDHFQSPDNLDSRLLGHGASIKRKAFETALAL